MKNAEVIRGYKVFNPDWTCLPLGNTKQYTCPGIFESYHGVELCNHGMHFCLKLADCFNYYPFNPENHVAEVVAHGQIAGNGDKCCTDKLEIVRELSWQEVLEMVNTGKGCSGNKNTGNCNTGDWNTGNCNTGDWNKSSFNTGCFMTEEQKIMFFNKPSDWTYNDWLLSDAWYLLNQIPKNVVEWIYSENMTDEEKAEHPTHKTTGGYLKVIDESKCSQIWWNQLNEDDRNIIRALPNFDPVIFKECTGIDTESEGE